MPKVQQKPTTAVAPYEGKGGDSWKPPAEPKTVRDAYDARVRGGR